MANQRCEFYHLVLQNQSLFDNTHLRKVETVDDKCVITVHPIITMH